MQDARHFRDQAKFCLEIAYQVSDQQIADSLRAEAAHYVKRATEVEHEVDSSSIDHGKAGGNAV